MWIDLSILNASVENNLNLDYRFLTQLAKGKQGYCCHRVVSGMYMSVYLYTFHSDILFSKTNERISTISQERSLIRFV